jgi:hypothetical protein
VIEQQFAIHHIGPDAVSVKRNLAKAMFFGFDHLRLSLPSGTNRQSAG